MNIKYIILSFFLLSATFSFGQDGLLQNELKVFPVSPGAASLGKYGEIPVNLASGKINYSIPIHTIKVGGFEWPIYLSYNYSGLLIEQDPSSLGLGWDLMAGGRITRQVRGLPDERDLTTYKKNTIIPFILNGTSYNEQYQIYDNIVDLRVDGQQDQYNLNAGNLSGSFVYNEDAQVVFLNHRNYVVNGTTVTDDKGNIYYFEEEEMGEYALSTVAGDVALLPIPTSFLLTRILLADNKGEINFQYGAGITYLKKVYSDTQVTGLDNNIAHSESLTSINYKPLEKITFPNGEVQFNISNHVDGSLNTFALNDITVLNGTGEVSKYELTYNSVSKSRKVLKSVVKTHLGQSLPYFELEYFNETSLGGVIDYTAQDFWGYYNAKPSTNLINASREIDTIRTKYGALKKITYPTGGTSTIVYEQNKVPDTDDGVSSSCSFSANTVINGRLDAISDGEQIFINDTIDLGRPQLFDIDITATVGSGSSGDAFGTEAQIKVSSSGGLASCGRSAANKIIAINGEEGDDTMTKSQQAHTSDGKIYITGYVLASPNKIAYVKYKIDYEDTVPTSNQLVGGIRVASTTDCSDNGPCVSKKYKYTLEDSNMSSGSLSGGIPIFQYTTDHVNEPTGGGQSGTRTYRSAKSKSSFTSYQGAPALYERVEIVQSLGENGKIVNTYSNSPNSNNIFPFAPSIDKGWKKGKLLSSHIYKYENGNYAIVSGTINEYQDVYPYGRGLNSTLKSYGFVVGRNKWSWSGGDRNEGIPTDFKDDWYIDYPKESKLTKTTTTQYFDTENLTDITEYVYDSPHGQLKQSLTTDSKANKFSTNIFYPYSVSGSFHNDLLDQNKISEPVIQETYKDQNNDGVFQSNEVLSQQETQYTNWGNNLFLPEFIKNKKGSGISENRLAYHDYYDDGNIKEVSKSNGPHIYLIWGYNGEYPIAKIENLESGQINTSMQNLIDAAVTASNVDNDRTIDILNQNGTITKVGNEGDLRQAVNVLRNSSLLSDSMVSTYTYDPLIGVTSMTDPRGYTIYYEYDEFNRLKEVRDADGNLVSDYKYNYKSIQP